MQEFGVEMQEFGASAGDVHRPALRTTRFVDDAADRESTRAPLQQRQRPPALHLSSIGSVEARVDEGAVAQIMEMGFSREQAVTALRKHSGVQDAVMSLLT